MPRLTHKDSARTPLAHDASGVEERLDALRETLTGRFVGPVSQLELIQLILDECDAQSRYATFGIQPRSLNDFAYAVLVSALALTGEPLVAGAWLAGPYCPEMEKLRQVIDEHPMRYGVHVDSYYFKRDFPWVSERLERPGSAKRTDALNVLRPIIAYWTQRFPGEIALAINVQSPTSPWSLVRTHVKDSERPIIPTELIRAHVRDALERADALDSIYRKLMSASE